MTRQSATWEVRKTPSRLLPGVGIGVDCLTPATFVTKIRLETTNGPMIEINDIVA